MKTKITTITAFFLTSCLLSQDVMSKDENEIQNNNVSSNLIQKQEKTEEIEKEKQATFIASLSEKFKDKTEINENIDSQNSIAFDAQNETVAMRTSAFDIEEKDLKTLQKMLRKLDPKKTGNFDFSKLSDPKLFDQNEILDIFDVISKYVKPYAEQDKPLDENSTFIEKISYAFWNYVEFMATFGPSSINFVVNFSSGNWIGVAADVYKLGWTAWDYIYKKWYGVSYKNLPPSKEAFQQLLKIMKTSKKTRSNFTKAKKELRKGIVIISNRMKKYKEAQIDENDNFYEDKKFNQTESPYIPKKYNKLQINKTSQSDYNLSEKDSNSKEKFEDSFEVDFFDSYKNVENAINNLKNAYELIDNTTKSLFSPTKEEQSEQNENTIENFIKFMKNLKESEKNLNKILSIIKHNVDILKDESDNFEEDQSDIDDEENDEKLDEESIKYGIKQLSSSFQRINNIIKSIFTIKKEKTNEIKEEEDQDQEKDQDQDQDQQKDQDQEKLLQNEPKK